MPDQRTHFHPRSWAICNSRHNIEMRANDDAQIAMMNTEKVVGPITSIWLGERRERGRPRPCETATMVKTIETDSAA